MAHEFGVRLALIAFATAAFEGLVSRSTFEPALTRALAALGLFYLLGCLCGELARRVVEENVQTVPSGGVSSAATAAPHR